MTQEAINSACAELCGWKPHLGSWECLVGHPKGGLVGANLIPPFTTSLDAAQMVFKALTGSQQIEAIRILALDILKLCPLAGDYFMAQEVDVCAIMLATPLQWCEAILKAAGKWEE